MSNRATGILEITSTVELDELAFSEMTQFLSEEEMNSPIAGFIKLVGVTLTDTPLDAIKKLVLYAGFNIAKATFATPYKFSENQIIHLLKYDNEWNENRVQLIIQFFASLGMGIFSEFFPENEPKKGYHAIFGSKEVVEDSRSNLEVGLDAIAHKARLLEKIAVYVNLIPSELTMLGETDKFSKAETLDEIAEYFKLTTSELIKIIENDEFPALVLLSELEEG